MAEDKLCSREASSSGPFSVTPRSHYLCHHSQNNEVIYNVSKSLHHLLISSEGVMEGQRRQRDEERERDPLPVCGKKTSERVNKQCGQSIVPYTLI